MMEKKKRCSGSVDIRSRAERLGLEGTVTFVAASYWDFMNRFPESKLLKPSLEVPSISRNNRKSPSWANICGHTPLMYSWS